MNVVERFQTASRAHDVPAAAAELAPDVVMLNPPSYEPMVGRELVTAAPRAAGSASDEFCRAHLLVDTASAADPTFGVVFEARVGDQILRGVDLVEIDDSRGLVSTSTCAGSTHCRADGARCSHAGPVARR